MFNEKSEKNIRFFSDFSLEILIFSDFEKNSKKHFFDFVFDLKKIFFGPEKKSGGSFDAENCVLSIPAVFMAIPALLAELSSINFSLLRFNNYL